MPTCRFCVDENPVQPEKPPQSPPPQQVSKLDLQNTRPANTRPATQARRMPPPAWDTGSSYTETGPAVTPDVVEGFVLGLLLTQKGTTSNASMHGGLPSGSFSDRVLALERVVGENVEGSVRAIAVRIDNLEMALTGQTNVGSLIERVAVLESCVFKL